MHDIFIFRRWLGVVVPARTAITTSVLLQLLSESKWGLLHLLAVLFITVRSLREEISRRVEASDRRSLINHLLLE